MNVLTVVGLLAALSVPPARFGEVSVREYGARGDSVHDDTQAFVRAIAAVAATGGVVRVPSVGPGHGYVLSRTLRIPAGVALVGSPAGFANNGWAAFPLPEKLLVGSKIFARPAPDQYSGSKKRPLFEMQGGATVRGIYILYDQQPWPSDEELADPTSPFHYRDFAEARERFIHDHVKPYGPTFYVTGPNVVVEDVVCDRYYDFYLQARGGRTYVDRVSLYGFRCGFAYGECLDVNRLSRVHLVPNVGPACPGKALPGRTYNWIYGIVTSDPNNVGVHVARSDGYVFSDLMFFGVHTALRLGASRQYPLRDTVEGVEAYGDPGTGAHPGFAGSYVAQGPWGSVSDLTADLCVVGVHMVWPTPLTNRMSNVVIHTGISDGKAFPTSESRAVSLGRQAAVLVEPTHVAANGIGIVPALLISNLSIGSFYVPDRFADAAADASRARGRAFLIDGDIAIEISNAQINSPYTEETTCAFGPAAKKATLRIRGLLRTGSACQDLTVLPGKQ